MNIVKNDVINDLLLLDIVRLEEKFKSREVTCGHVKTPFIVRLDGVNFGSKLKNFEKPRDRKVHEALINVCEELIQVFGANICHVVSDELNIVFLNYAPYGGRIFKIVSISAGLASAKLTNLLNTLLYFDSRVIPVENVYEVLDYLRYRARVGLNNYLATLAAIHKLYPKGETPRIHVMLSDLANYLDEEWKFLGTILIREVVEKKAINKLTGEEVVVKRRKIVKYEFSVGIKKLHEILQVTS